MSRFQDMIGAGLAAKAFREKCWAASRGKMPTRLWLYDGHTACQLYHARTRSEVRAMVKRDFHWVQGQYLKEVTGVQMAR